MKLFQWLKFLKTPPPEKRVRESLDSNREKIYRPRSVVLKRESRLKKSGTEATDNVSQSFREQRRHERYSTEGMDFQAKMVLSEEVDIANMSIGGACVVTKRTVTPGENVLLDFADVSIDRTLKCKVIWEREPTDDATEASSRHYQTGVQFQEVPPYTLIRLKDFMRESGVPDMKKLEDQYLSSSLRFKIYRNRKAFMKYPSLCPVKKISLGGMLIETNQEYAVEQRYPMALYLADKNAPIKCTGRIASQLPVRDEQAVRYDTGIEFLNLADHDRAHLSKFLSHL
ncbi:MAG: PilZ domain-containing protein [Thermodesulfovibrionales bacterium]|nr:PilZ domain-containing protein [Thermodesulfovibrionales bacterium]